MSTPWDAHFCAEGLDGSRAMPRTFHPGSARNTRATDEPWGILNVLSNDVGVMVGLVHTYLVPCYADDSDCLCHDSVQLVDSGLV